MKNIIYLLSFAFIIVFNYSCVSQKTDKSLTVADSTFSMVFMTDIHLQPELNAIEGFRKAMDSINKLKPNFVITGGDLIMDALAQNHSRADSLYDLFNHEIKRLTVPVYNSIGNHELFGVYEKSGIDTMDAMYGNKMFLQRIGKTYYSFKFKQWKFFVLETVFATANRQNTGYINPTQIAWLKKELFNTDAKTPIAIVLHIPMLTSITQFNKGALVPNTEGLVLNNSKELMDVFNGYNLKLVLQGHLHVLEDNYIKNIHFITGGAVCGAWWKGPNEGTEEGFILMKFSGSEFNWQYIDYGWDPAKKLNK